MSLSRIQEPAALPVTAPELKEHCRVVGTDDDAYVQALLGAAITIVEDITRRRLITQTWDYFLYSWPCSRVLELPYPPLQSVTHVKYKSDNGSLVTMPSTDYEVDSKAHVGAVRLLPTFTSWPSLNSNVYVDRVEIRFVCGYGEPEDVPDPIKHAIKFLVALWYGQREPISMNLKSLVPMTVEVLLAPYRIYNFL